MKRYEIRINLQPEVHKGQIKYYWQIVLITNDGVFTVKHGFESTLESATLKASQQAKNI